jgi:pimeloyl-ACP methyl ester carboxylesterase
MRGRLGQEVPEAMFTWWTDLMRAAHPQMFERLLAHIAGVDLPPPPGSYAHATLMISRAGSVLASVNSVEPWAKAIPNCRLYIIPGTSYHLKVRQIQARADQATANGLSVRIELQADSVLENGVMVI